MMTDAVSETVAVVGRIYGSSQTRVFCWEYHILRAHQIFEGSTLPNSLTSRKTNEFNL